MQHSLETLMQASRYCLFAKNEQTGEPPDVALCDVLTLTVKTTICSQPHSEQNCSRECNPPQQLRRFCA
jgi:hypothetical protein